MIGVTLSLGWAWFDLERVPAKLAATETGWEASSRPQTLLQLLAARPFDYLAWLVISSFISFNWRIIAFFFMSLTNYLLQSVAMNIVFAAFAMNLYDKMSRWEVLVWFSGVFLIPIVISIVWLRLFSIGPVESIWRSLTYRGL